MGAENRIQPRHVLTTDEAGLDAILRAHPVPEKFNLGISSIPISWFVGLKESDELGTKVFVESVIHSPRQFLASTMTMAWEALRDPTMYPIFPTTDNVALYCDRVIHQQDGRLQLVQRVDHSFPYRYSTPYVWDAGFRFFSAASGFPSCQPLIMAVLLLGFVAALIAGLANSWTLRTVTPVILTIALAAFVIASAAVLEFRWKETRLVLPLVAMLVGLACGSTFPEVIGILTRSFGLRRSAAAPER